MNKYKLWSVCMFLAFLWGGICNYSPVPFGDMWKQYITMETLGSGVWFEPFNNHLPILSRIFYWADLKYFGGIFVFLIISSYFLTLINAKLFLNLLENQTKKNHKFGYLESLIFGLSISWMQSENFTWGFNIHYILVNFTSFISFYFLYKSSLIQSKKDFYIVISILFSIISIFTLGNGILILPLLIFGLLILKDYLRALFVAIFGMLLVLIFIKNYGYNPNLISLPGNTVSFLLYIFLFIGSPIWHLIHLGAVGKFLSIVSGIFFTWTVFYKFRNLLNCNKKNKFKHLELFLFLFLAYVLCTAILTSIARSSLYGYDQALVGRYSTIALSGWIAFIILYNKEITLLCKKYITTSKIMILIIMVLISLVQTKAIRFHNNLNPRSEAALALKIGVNDENLITNSLHIKSEVALELTRLLNDKKTTVFSRYPLSEINSNFKTDRIKYNLDDYCAGTIISLDSLPKDSNYLKITGYIFNIDKHFTPKLIYFYTEKEILIGYGLTKKNINHKEILSVHGNLIGVGYVGYILNNAKNNQIKLKADYPLCKSK
jgi:hypothetical protein